MEAGWTLLLGKRKEEIMFQIIWDMVVFFFLGAIQKAPKRKTTLPPNSLGDARIFSRVGAEQHQPLTLLICFF
jgi:hypothetical protein